MHPGGFKIEILTIIDDYTRDAKLVVDFLESVDDIVGLGEVGRNVELFVRAVCFFQ